MKKTLLLVFCFSCFLLRAQSRQTINYQAIVRDAQGQLWVKHWVGVRITVLHGTSETSVQSSVYEETHTPMTDDYGTYALKIGAGIAAPGNRFETIDWSNGYYAIQVEIDLNGGDNYTLTSTIDVLSIPLALHAQTAQRLVENPQENDPIFAASVVKNITETDVQNWNEKLDSIDLIPLQNSLQTKADTALLNMLKNEIEVLKKSVEDLQIDLQIANGTLVKDIDGNIYKTQKYGNQTWMIENLRVSKYNDGTAIDYAQSDSTWFNKHEYTMELSGGMYYGVYVAPPLFCFSDTTPEKIAKYGALYNWHTVNPANGKQLCPKGWHVPTIGEWDVLRQQLITDGYNYDGTTTGNKVGKSMAAETGWEYSNIEGSAGNTDYSEKKNLSDFTAYPAGSRSVGYRSSNDEPTAWFSRVNQYAEWWSTGSQYYQGILMGRYAAVRFDKADLFICPYGSAVQMANSIRCLKD